MKLLAIDTATEACSAAVNIDGDILEQFELAPRQHAVRILPMIESVLAEAGVNVSALDAIAVGRGPGSFTGLRIAAGVAQGIGFAAGLPLLPVSTLAAMALDAARRTTQSHVLAAIDARMDQVYVGAYRSDGAGSAELLGEERVCAPAAVTVPVVEVWVGAGSGWAAYAESLTQRLAGRVEEVIDDCYPRAGDIARLAARKFANGEAVAAEDFAPTYLRDKVTHGG